MMCRGCSEYYSWSTFCNCERSFRGGVGVVSVVLTNIFFDVKEPTINLLSRLHKNKNHHVVNRNGVAYTGYIHAAVNLVRVKKNVFCMLVNTLKKKRQGMSRIFRQLHSLALQVVEKVILF